MQRIGELAAFGTAICWTVSAIFFEKASRRSGSLAVNFYKVVIAFVLLTAVAAISRGQALPVDAPRETWFYLSLSGIVGFVIADLFLFSAYVHIGSRMTTLFLALSPPITALIGFVTLGELMSLRGILGMALVLSGIIVAVLGKGDLHHLIKGDATMRKGYLFALLSSLGQAVGMILTKKGLGDYHPIAGTQIRILAGFFGFSLAIVIFRETKRVFVDALRDREGMKSTIIGAVFGPFIGVSLSLFAIQHTLTGTASTLIGLTPVLIIAPSIVMLKQKVKPLEIFGALLAVCGAALFFL